MEREIASRVGEAMEGLGFRSSFFTSPSYDDAVLGYTESGNVVYSYERMVESLMLHDGMEWEEAADFVGYNAIRTIPYMPEPRPVIVYGLEV